MKHAALFVIGLLLCSTVVFGQGLQKGDFVASVNSEGWTLSSGTGDRSYIEFVTFDKGFDSPPTVIVSITGYDATVGKDQTVKLNLSVDKITKAGCVIKIKTWGECKVGAVWGSWLAFSK
jgi:hypothetical protein